MIPELNPPELGKWEKRPLTDLLRYVETAHGRMLQARQVNYYFYSCPPPKCRGQECHSRHWCGSSLRDFVLQAHAAAGRNEAPVLMATSARVPAEIRDNLDRDDNTYWVGDVLRDSQRPHLGDRLFLLLWDRLTSGGTE